MKNSVPRLACCRVKIQPSAAQELSELNTQITLAEAVRTEAEERAKSIKNILATKGTVVGSTDVITHHLSKTCVSNR